MNKRDFLRMLDNELSVLDRVERKELLDFYEERFHTGTIYEAKTEEEVIAELEHPRIIARNILEEYGATPKFVKKKEERYENVNTGQAILVIVFDVLVISWLVPSLFSVFASVSVSLLTWVTAIPLITGPHNIVDQYVFTAITAGYILLFMFALVVLELLIWTVKKTIIWHLNVFKIKKRDKFIKKSSSFSVDKFFKNHKGLRFLKNILTIGSIIAIAVSGLWMVNHSELVKSNYTSELMTETNTFDFTPAIANDDEWNINFESDVYDVTIEYVDSSELTVVHKYKDKDDYIYNIDETNNEIYIYDVDQDLIVTSFGWDISDLFDLIFNENQSITLKVPSDLIIDNVDVKNSVGRISINNQDAKSMTVISNTGTITLKDINVSGNLKVSTDTGSINLKNVTANNTDVEADTGSINIENLSSVIVNAETSTGSITIEDSIALDGESSITASANTGKIELSNVSYLVYNLASDTGSITLDELNVDNQDGTSIKVKVDTGHIDLSDVYVLRVDLETDTGYIKYTNTIDTNFKCDSIIHKTDTGNENITVGTK